MREVGKKNYCFHLGQVELNIRRTPTQEEGIKENRFSREREKKMLKEGRKNNACMKLEGLGKKLGFGMTEEGKGRIETG